LASFTASPTYGLAPLAVTFTDTSTGDITNRFWDFGDSGTTNTTTNSIAHSYALGTYTVTLVVTGPNGVSTNTQPNCIAALTAFQNWQMQYFGSTTSAAAAANADSDGDGFSNLQKYLAGTDPTNSASSFHVISVVPTGSDLLVTWMMGSGRTNALQATAGDAYGGYTTDNFADIFTVTNTVGTTTNYLDTGVATNVSARYYRVRLVP
jgi:PKD repeat protein